MANPAPIESPTTTTTKFSNTTTPDIYQRLHSYSFATDPEFKLGLAVILGHPATPATDEQVNSTDDLVLRAKCFFFSKKFSINPQIDFLAYKTWLSQDIQRLDLPLEINPSDPEPSGTHASSVDLPSDTISALSVASKTASEKEQPVYPSSFAHIVELITTGQPIPGIQQIPDTVLTGQDTPSSAERRRKPWEKDEVNGKESEEQGNKSANQPEDLVKSLDLNTISTNNTPSNP